MGRGRSIYLAVVGAVVGALAVGLLMPFAVDSDPTSSVATGAGSGGSSVGAQDGGTGPTGTGETVVGNDPEPTSGATNGSGSASGGPSAPAGAGGGQPGPDGPSSPAAPGTPVKVGFTILDVGTVGRAGINVAISTEQQERAWRAFVKDVNERNLIGRPIEPVFSTFDALNQDSQTASCLELTEDHKVFAVLGGYNYAAPNFCVVNQHATPLVSNMGSNPDSYYTQTAGRLITATARSSRMFTNAVAVLDSAGALKGKKVGILRSDANDPSGEATGHLEQALRAAGHEVVHTSRLPAPPASDSQIPVEVNEMRQSGAEVVFLLAGSTSSTGFVQAADAQAYRPRYITTDWGAMFNTTSSANMPASYDGTLGVTNARESEWRADRPEPQLAAECRSVYERESGTKLAARGTNEHTLTVIYCDLMRAFVAGMRAGGPSTTKEQFPAAMARVGPMQWGSWGDGSFRAGKSDGGDDVLLQRWQAGCKCFHPVGDFRPPRA